MDETLTLSMFFEAWELFRAPALSGAFAGALLGALGVYIVLRRMVFVSAALAQTAGLGVTLSFFATSAWPALAFVTPFWGSTTLTLLVAVLLVAQTERFGFRRESMLGAAYLAGAAGALAVGTRIVQEHHDIESLLFGSAVAVTDDDFTTLWVTCVVLGGVHLWARRGFVQASFDPDGARVRGLPVTVLEMALFGSIAIAISQTTRILGALPVFAFSVLPAMAALRVARNVPLALMMAAAVGGACGFVGYVAAFLYKLPVGASQTLVGLLCVVVAGVWGAGWARLRATKPPPAATVS